MCISCAIQHRDTAVLWHSYSSPVPGFSPGRHSQLKPLRAVRLLDQLVLVRQELFLEQGRLDAGQSLPAGAFTSSLLPIGPNLTHTQKKNAVHTGITQYTNVCVCFCVFLFHLLRAPADTFRYEWVVHQPGAVGHTAGRPETGLFFSLLPFCGVFFLSRYFFFLRLRSALRFAVLLLFLVSTYVLRCLFSRHLKKKKMLR